MLKKGWYSRPTYKYHECLIAIDLAEDGNPSLWSGFLNLSFTMYTFSDPTDEHVPLQHFNRRTYPGIF